jgi:hypothetical protein
VAAYPGRIRSARSRNVLSGTLANPLHDALDVRPKQQRGYDDGRTFVIRIRGDKTDWVDVRTGLTSPPLVEVFGDLRAGDEVAARGTDEMRPGTEVRAREAKPIS